MLALIKFKKITTELLLNNKKGVSDLSVKRNDILNYTSKK